MSESKSGAKSTVADGQAKASPPAGSVVDTSVIGVSICTNCQSRFKVQQRYAGLVGKAIRCPKCHQTFVLKIEQPSPVEQAAITNSEPPAAKTRKKRTKLQIRKHYFNGIKKSIRPFHLRLKQMSEQDKCSEEQVRVWCIDVLRTVLGYKDTEIDTEMYALNQRIDIALKRDGKVFMVIECKNTRSKLPSSAINQAVSYAANKSADWAVVTSGQVWRLLRVFPVKGADPRVVEVFNISMLDEDGVSARDIANLFLLTSRSIFGGETEKAHHRVACLSHQNLLASLTTTRVIRAIRRSALETYKKSSKQTIKLTEAFVEDRVRELFTPADLSDEPKDAGSSES